MTFSGREMGKSFILLSTHSWNLITSVFWCLLMEGTLISMFLSLLDLDPLLFLRLRIQILPSTSKKKCMKTLVSAVQWLLDVELQIKMDMSQVFPKQEDTEERRLPLGPSCYPGVPIDKDVPLERYNYFLLFIFSIIFLLVILYMTGIF